MLHHDTDVSADETEIAVLTKLNKKQGGKDIEHDYVRILSLADGKEIYRWDPEDHLAEFDPAVTLSYDGTYKSPHRQTNAQRPSSHVAQRPSLYFQQHDVFFR